MRSLSQLSLRATSRKTRIETPSTVTVSSKQKMVSEQHPGKQGLKHHELESRQMPSRVSEQHPGKQGLKQRESYYGGRCEVLSQSNIQENKD